jgi:hypothetical protein
MGGWFADIFIEWIVRMVAKVIRRIQSHRWPVVDGVVTRSLCSRALYGCHVADVHYDYSFEDVEYSAFHEEPFLMHDSGEEWARSVRIGSKILVRVNPHDPSQTVSVLG